MLRSLLSPRRQGPARPAQGHSFADLPFVAQGSLRFQDAEPALNPGPLAVAGASRSAEQAQELPVLSTQHRETLCGTLGLGLKVAVALVAGVSLVRLAGAYQERMEHHAELRAVLTVQSAKLEKARTRFDQLFAIGGEQTLIRQQGQWIAPNRLRVVWNR